MASPVPLTTACGRCTTTGIFPPGRRVELTDRGAGIDGVEETSGDLQPLIKSANTHNTAKLKKNADINDPKIFHQQETKNPIKQLIVTSYSIITNGLGGACGGSRCNVPLGSHDRDSLTEELNLVENNQRGRCNRIIHKLNEHKSTITTKINRGNR